ncbi:hypothetical protein [Micromonospora sp. CB01531]|uniref:hypothetical protein n=1 Tax=Micromonospora sp. CB01531 TaxID=1718947 RepID=UPI00093F75E0|nr:hypothetical protein [Micromonospora sp. CB01531]OKI45087.1 hypothetical protein A6A27_11755 [Micromonospora sp. CB01531]
MKNKSVDHIHCTACHLRGFLDKHDADKALGRAQAKRDRLAAKRGTGRGIRRESRYFRCSQGLFHLTATPRKDVSQ